MKASEIHVQTTSALMAVILALVAVLHREKGIASSSLASYLRALIDGLPQDMRNGPYEEILRRVELACEGSDPLSPEEFARLLH